MPKVDLGNVPCGGYATEQFDFPALHPQLGGTARELLGVMLEAAATAEAFPDAGRFCTIVIVGHSDRVDTPGLTQEARRARERDVSEWRAESAQAWFFREVCARLQAGGFTVPPDQTALRNVDILTVPCGSAVLVHPTPSGEPQRRENRRVEFIGTIFTPGTA